MEKGIIGLHKTSQRYAFFLYLYPPSNGQKSSLTFLK